MTSGSSSNITTQWNFRDGRDYVLSLTTTEMPNTVCFWISDKITGEEWTASYDESGIEVITKRTGCYKSFHTFVSMIKSAILKKSEAVIIELLNMDDLNAISLHRQNLQHGGGLSSPSTENSRILSPLNFQLYNSELESNPTSSSQFSPSSKKSPTAQALNAGNGNQPKNNIKTPVSLPSSLNKRKYLIVTYIAEFDRVHYPLPLNYSNPPDLNVMQKNILQLKAEVVSLQSAKKELTNELQAIKSGSMSQPSHEDNHAIYSQDKTRSLSPRKGAIIDNFEPATAIGAKGRKDGLGDTTTLEGFQIPGDDKELSTVNCQRCSGTMASLRARIRDLEHATDFQKGEHMQAMEKLQNENHFLRYKVEAAEKYEMELWDQIQVLKEKVEQADLDKENQLKSFQECKDILKAQAHRSRHDVFYKSYKRPTSPRKKSTIPQSKFPIIDDTYQRATSVISLQGRRSNSTGSNRSSGSLSSKSEPRQTIVPKPTRRSSYSPYHHSRTNVSPSPSKGRRRSVSSSPSKSQSRFDPTAYITQKKQRQSTVANIRMQNIESRIRANAKSRSVSRTNPSEERSVRTRNLRSHRSSSGETFRVDNAPKANQQDDVYIYYKKQAKKGENRGEKSAKPILTEDDANDDIRGQTHPLPPHELKATRKVSIAKDNQLPSSSDKQYKHKRAIRNLKDLVGARDERFFAKPLTQLTPLTSLNTPDYIMEINKRVQESTEELLEARPKSSGKTRSKSMKEPISEDVGNSSRMEKTKANSRKPDENYNITQLQTKLSALQTFLETCKVDSSR